MIKVYRGSNFHNDINSSRFKALYFTEDLSFAEKFGIVKLYLLKTERNELDITGDNYNTVLNIIATSNNLELHNLQAIFDEGNFWKIYPDSGGWHYRPLDKLIDYAKENNYDSIKMIEHYSQNINPIIYVVLNDTIVYNTKEKPQ